MNRRDFVSALLTLPLFFAACRRREEHVADAGPLPLAPRTAFVSPHRENLAAACARILPIPGAGPREARVPEYIDRTLLDERFAALRRALQGGLLALERRAQKFGGKSYAALDPREQDEVLAQLQSGGGERGAAFLELLVTLTLEGFLGDPSHGGNRDRIGFAFIGYSPQDPRP